MNHVLMDFRKRTKNVEELNFSCVIRDLEELDFKPKKSKSKNLKMEQMKCKCCPRWAEGAQCNGVRKSVDVIDLHLEPKYNAQRVPSKM